MLQETVNDLPLYRFSNLSTSDIKHFVTSKAGGISTGDKQTLNLSFKVNDLVLNVQENRLRLAKSMGIEPTKLIFPHQTHTNTVQIVSSTTSEDDLQETDAVITNEKGICLAVMSADCVPVLVYDPVKKVIGAAHAGWRGTVGKIASNMVKLMQETYGSNPKDIIAAIGPSISPQVYEVGQEVIDATTKAFGTIEGLIRLNPEKPGKGNFNLWEANKRALEEAGLESKNIEIAGICTFQNSDKFFSHRSNPNTGRFAAGILIN